MRAQCLVVSLFAVTASAQVGRPRVAILIDSSGSMMATPEIVTFPETCAAQAWSGCTSSGNPSATQETCNACMAWTIRVNASCATNFSNTCRTTYANCWRAFNGGTGCGQVLGVTDGVPTRGNGTVLTPGCDVDGDGVPNDSRLARAKAAVRAVVASNTNAELSLWRYVQVEGGQTCTLDTDCPVTPAGRRLMTCQLVSGTKRCVLDAASLGSLAGQCSPRTWNGANSSFTCAGCSDTASDRLGCEAYKLDTIRTGGLSSVTGSVVNCALPTDNHPFLFSQGATLATTTCDPSGGQKLVAFPSGMASNHPALDAWLDGQQVDLQTDVELVAHGRAPLAATLRDLRTDLIAAAQADPSVPCRKYHVVLVVDGTEECETIADAVTAAGNFSNLSFTTSGGVTVNNFNIKVNVIGIGICPPSNPSCQAKLDLDSIAAAGGTAQATVVTTSAQLQQALNAILAGTQVAETCNQIDDNCDGVVDEGFTGLGSTCSAGIGACFASGTVGCNSTHDGVTCSAMPRSPATELCNGIDDDCNGIIDNGVCLDAGAPDAGPVDGGSGDAGSGDAGSGDAGSIDAGSVDAGSDAGPPTDAGTVSDAGVDSGVVGDAGSSPDAGAMNDDAGVDAGEVTDAGGPTDAGSTEDAGVNDAGLATDAGSTIDAGQTQDAGQAIDAGAHSGEGADAGDHPTTAPQGCGCNSQSGSLALALALLVLSRRKPRQDGPRSVQPTCSA